MSSKDKDIDYKFVCNNCRYEFYIPKGGRCPNCDSGNYHKEFEKWLRRYK